MKILMICYYFPPITDIGSRRSISFARYFQRYGWTPLVLSVSNPDPHYCSTGPEQPPEGVETVYAASLGNVYRLFGRLNGVLDKLFGFFNIRLKRNYLYDLCCIPDHFFGWIPPAALKGRALIKKAKPDLIYVSCSPFSSAIVGVLLKKLTGLPLVVDFRDPFGLEALADLGLPRFRMRINKKIEKMILNNVDRLVVTTEETRTLYTEQYPDLQKKICTVHNGFEPKGLNLRSDKFGKFTIIYAGQFYSYDQRNEHFTHDFFAAIKSLKDQGIVSPESFQFVYFGSGGDAIAEFAVKHGVEGLVVIKGSAPHQVVLESVSRSHLQLLRIVKPMISTKLFEGISLNVPFIATIPEGEVAEIVRKYSPGSYLVTESSTEKIVASITDAMQKYENAEILSNRTNEFLQNYSRESLALKMMDLIRMASLKPMSG